MPAPVENASSFLFLQFSWKLPQKVNLALFPTGSIFSVEAVYPLNEIEDKGFTHVLTHRQHIFLVSHSNAQTRKEQTLQFGSPFIKLFLLDQSDVVSKWGEEKSKLTLTLVASGVV